MKVLTENIIFLPLKTKGIRRWSHNIFKYS